LKVEVLGVQVLVWSFKQIIMKNMNKLILVIILMIFNNSTSAQNGFIKCIDKFEGTYLGSINNNLLFIENLNEINVYNNQMEFLETKKVDAAKLVGEYGENNQSFYPNTALAYSLAKGFPPFDWISISDGMIYIDKTYFKNNGEGGYDYNEINVFSLDNLTTPKYSKKFKSMPAYPDVNSSKNKEFYTKYSKYTREWRVYREDKIYRIYRASFKPFGKKETLNNIDKDKCENFYLVVFDKELNILKEGFLPNVIKENEDYEDFSFSIDVVDDHLILNKTDYIQTATPRNEQTIYHISLTEKEFKVVNEIKIDDHLHVNIEYAISPDKKYLIGNSYFVDSKSGFGLLKKFKGQSVFKYNLDQAKIEKVKLFTYEDGKGVYVSTNFTERPYFIGENIIIKRIKNTDLMTAFIQLSTPICFFYTTMSMELDVISENKIIYNKSDEEHMAQIVSFHTYYDEKNQDLRFFMMNMPQKERTKVAKEFDGSSIIQVDYDNGNFKTTYIPFPDDLKYLNRTITKMVRHPRAKYFSLPYTYTINQFGTEMNTLVSTPYYKNTVSIVRMND